jgi:acyl-CoA synthetase (AMP-forming)/AMP-acid ligase II
MAVSSETANAASIIVDRHISENNGDRNALRFRDKRYSYHDLAALMNRAGNMMHRLGVHAGDAVLIAVAPSPSLLASVFGAMKIGAVPIMLSADTGQAAIASVSGKSKPKLLIAEAARLAKLGATGNIMVLVVGEGADGAKSFVQEMRESASSLTRTAVANGTMALALLRNGDLLSFAHQQLAGVRSGADLALQLDGWNLGAALGRFARGEEEVIA